MRRIGTVTVVAMLALSLGVACKRGGTDSKGKAEACAAVTPSADAQRLGIVLPGGQLCKEGGSVGTVEYPGEKGTTILTNYKTRFPTWKADSINEKTLLLTNGDAEGLFIIAGDSSQQRDVPFAIVRYCVDRRGCADVAGLAGAMKKIEKAATPK